MKTKTIYMRDDIAFAMAGYDRLNNHRFNHIDLFVMEVLLSDAYITDLNLAEISLSSLSTVKRSINKLCKFGFIKKHLAHDNTKTLEICEDFLNTFLDTYFYAEPYYSRYVQLSKDNGIEV